MIRLSSKGDYQKVRNWLKKQSGRDVFANLDKFGQEGVLALSRSTPVDTGRTAEGWRYRIIRNRKRPAIQWYNTNVRDGYQVAVLIQYGHGTGTGGYVQGRDYINPAMRPVFDKIVSEFWKEVSSWQK